MTEAELEGLRGEVDYEDTYHLRYKEDVVSVNDPKYIHVKGHERGFNFEPELIFDLGANVGVFSLYCRRLFPNARIIAVEPDPTNCIEFKANVNDANIILIERAIGNGGPVYRSMGALNGSGECYLSVGLGYPQDMMDGSVRLQKVDVKSITIKELFSEHYGKSKKTILKLDIEGGENAIFEDDESVELLKLIDYLVFELHFYALRDTTEVHLRTESVLDRFNETHNCLRDHIYFYATKKLC